MVHKQCKNATFTIRHDINGALLYYQCLCQKGQDELYKDTSISAERYAVHSAFLRAGGDGADAEVMICSDHAA